MHEPLGQSIPGINVNRDLRAFAGYTTFNTVTN